MRSHSGTFTVSDAIVGHFEASCHATLFQLFLAIDRSFTLDYWSGLKGWSRAGEGHYSVEGSIVRFVAPQRIYTDVIAVPFGIREAQGHTVLVPVKSLSEFDEAIAAGTWTFWSGRVDAGSLHIFTRQPLPRAVVCINPDVFGHALTLGKRYLVLEEREDRSMLRLFGDQGRLRWFPSRIFAITAERPTT